MCRSVGSGRVGLGMSGPWDEWACQDLCGSRGSVDGCLQGGAGVVAWVSVDGQVRGLGISMGRWVSAWQWALAGFGRSRYV